MKFIKRSRIYILLTLTTTLVFMSCKRELSCEGCAEKNKLPIALAGPDQVITLPTDSICWMAERPVIQMG
jgi:hypothetical protein